jgi:ribosomal protein S20
MNMHDKRYRQIDPKLKAEVKRAIREIERGDYVTIDEAFKMAADRVQKYRKKRMRPDELR